MRARVAATLGCLLASTAAWSADWQGSARLWVAGGGDTNVARTFTDGGTPTLFDGVASGTLALEGSVVHDALAVTGTYELGGRKFFSSTFADTVVQSAFLEPSVQVMDSLVLGAAFHGRDRRGASRDYSVLSPEAFVLLTLSEQFDLRARVGYQRFFYWPSLEASYWSIDTGATAVFRATKRHVFSAFFEYSGRTYNALADDTDFVPIAGRIRADTVLSAGGSYSYRGVVRASIGYAFTDSSSNSYGVSYSRHRITGVLAVPLPFEFTVLANGALQFTRYPDNVDLDPRLVLLEDGDNTNSISAKLVREFGEHVELDLRYALYSSTMHVGLAYLRHVFSFGVAAKF